MFEAHGPLIARRGDDAKPSSPAPPLTEQTYFEKKRSHG
jgi:hypothetical protein